MLAESDHQHSPQMALLSPQLQLYTPSSTIVGTCYTADLPTGVRSAVAVPDPWTAEQSFKIAWEQVEPQLHPQLRAGQQNDKVSMTVKGACTIAAFFQSVQSIAFLIMRSYQLLVQCRLQWCAAAVPSSQSHHGPVLCATVPPRATEHSCLSASWHIVEYMHHQHTHCARMRSVTRLLSYLATMIGCRS